jgi:hypothetical protein
VTPASRLHRVTSCLAAWTAIRAPVLGVTPVLFTELVTDLPLTFLRTRPWISPVSADARCTRGFVRKPASRGLLGTRRQRFCPLPGMIPLHVSEMTLMTTHPAHGDQPTASRALGGPGLINTIMKRAIRAERIE